MLVDWLGSVPRHLSRLGSGVRVSAFLRFSLLRMHFTRSNIHTSADQHICIIPLAKCDVSTFSCTQYCSEGEC